MTFFSPSTTSSFPEEIWTTAFSQLGQQIKQHVRPTGIVSTGADLSPRIALVVLREKMAGKWQKKWEKGGVSCLCELARTCSVGPRIVSAKKVDR